MQRSILDIVLDLLKPKSIRLAAAALVIVTVLFAAVAGIVNFKSLNGTSLALENNFDPLGLYVFGYSYLIFFIIIWVILYFMYAKEGDDFYSGVRAQLAGSWTAVYEASHGSHSGLDAPFGVKCELGIDPGDRKLQLHFIIEDHPIFQDHEQSIPCAGLSWVHTGEYQLMYYYEGKRRLRPVIQDLILREPGIDPAEIGIEIFGVVSFRTKVGAKRVEEMKGTWYDLNGRVTQLFALVDEARAKSADGRPRAPRRLADVQVGPHNFAARMGGVVFRR